jgi:protein required for attachment to host cells
MATTAKTRRTWFVLADGMHARILRQEVPRGPLVPALDHDLVAPAVHGHARDLKSDRPGRAFSTGTNARHAMEPRHDPHDHEKRHFARRVADLINDAAARDAFEHLVLVAPPRVLGELRAALDERASKRITGEVTRDLIRTPVTELPDQLAPHLAPFHGLS